MLQVTREVVTDVATRSTSKLVTAKQNDDGSRFLNVRIQNGGKNVDIDSTATVLLNVKRPDDSTGTLYGSVNDDGTVRVELNAWVLEHAGSISCDISIISKESAKLTTMTFYIDIEPAVCCDEDIVDAEEYSVLVDLINQTQELCEATAVAAEIAEQAMQRIEEGIADGELACSHSWNGSVLTVTSASGTSSADLRGPVGPTGPEADPPTAAELGLGNVDNTSDMDKPISTAQQEALDGKAPAGYGIGALEIYTAASDSAVDSVLTTQINGLGNQTFKRFVLASTNTANFIGGGYYYADIYKMESNYAIITIKSYLAGGRTLQRLWTKESNETAATLKDWEWVNPPLSIGVEYRTTERYGEAPVYVQAIDFGYGSGNGEKSADMGCVVSNLVRIEGHWYYKDDVLLKHPFTFSSFVTNIRLGKVTSGTTTKSSLYVATTSSNYYGLPIVYYTK